MPAADVPAAVTLRGISFSYGGETGLRDVDLAVPRGEYLGIVGPNGGGKTTLLKIILGLLEADAGEVRLFGEDLAAFRDWSRIAYVSQKATQVGPMFPMTVEGVVAMGRYARAGRLRGLDARGRAHVTDALRQVEMEDYRTRLIGDLSGGQQQRVFIARALAGEPEMIVLDEPTSAVDAGTRVQFYALLKRLNRELGLTLVLASHELEVVERDATRVAVIDRTLVFSGTPDELRASAARSAIEEEMRAHHHH